MQYHLTQHQAKSLDIINKITGNNILFGNLSIIYSRRGGSGSRGSDNGGGSSSDSSSGLHI